jgi:hypothetical protein
LTSTTAPPSRVQVFRKAPAAETAMSADTVVVFGRVVMLLLFGGGYC